MSGSGLNGRTVLVVEDDYFIAQELRRGLTREGAVVVGPVPSVAAAMDLLATRTIDAAVLDINLGQEDSFPVALKLEAQGTPFVFASGYNSADVPPSWQHVFRMEKPVQMSKLAQALSAAS